MRALRVYLLLVLTSVSGCVCDDPERAPGGDLCKTPATCPRPTRGCEIATCQNRLCGIAALDPGTRCDGGVCDESHDCVACRKNDAGDPEETDVDCGGSGCPPCETDQHCKVASDCRYGVCTANKCSAPGCNDGVQNAPETDIDCGGDKCKRCGPGKKCARNEDCQSIPTQSIDNALSICKDDICCAVPCDGLCQTCMPDSGACTFFDAGTDPYGRCAGEGDLCDGNGNCILCTDQGTNGQETGVDCGGGICPPCAIGDLCNNGSDCMGGMCANGKCVAPNCSDNQRNGSETDVDCGGPCGATCGIGMKCATKGDCLSKHCVAGFCVLP